MKTSDKTGECKKLLVSWLAIYPVITLLVYGLGDLTGSLPLYAQTFILTIITVPLMSYLVTPFFHQLFLRKRET